MSSVTISVTDTFEQWRVKTNSLGSQNGDLTSLSTTAKGSLVDAINEIVASDSDDMENVVDDTTPQLGGDLDLNDFNIINKEILGSQIASVHNLYFYMWLVRKARKQIKNDTFHSWKDKMILKLNNKL